jgi:hypothetical protein
MRFYFHLRSDEGFEEDVDGMEFPTLDEAVAETRKAAREMVAEIILRGERVDDRVFEIAKADGTILKTVPFREFLGVD